MRRSPDHVFQFMMAELGTEGSIDGNQRLVIRGKFVPRYIESLLRKYVGEYVICQMCRSYNTTLKRDQTSRLYFVECVPADCKEVATNVLEGSMAGVNTKAFWRGCLDLCRLRLLMQSGQT